MQSAQHDRLKQLIQSSVILTPSEKSEWLEMLIIMNDKQAVELEGILKAESPRQPVGIEPDIIQPMARPVRPNIPQKPVILARPTTPVSGSVPPNLPTPSAGTPKLSHISNLPIGLVSGGNIGARPIPAPLIAHPTPPVLKPMSAAAPAPTTLPTMHEPRPRSMSMSIAPQPEPYANANAGPSQLESVTDAGQLTLSSLRSLPSADLLLRLQQLSQVEGYFSLLSHIEDSPLYKSYIATGKKMLSGPTQVDPSKPDPNMLTKTEFETFADILRHIQLN